MNARIFLAGCLMATSVAAETPVLNVYTYDSFTSDWGPGPKVEEAFEATCGCDLKFTAAGDGAALLARLQLEGAKTDADIVLGLDNNLMAKAKDTGLFAALPKMDVTYSLPLTWNDTHFAPYDWGYFSFVYDKTKLKTVPTSFTDLAASDTSIVIQDPRSSTPGLGLMMWVKDAYGDEAPKIWSDLSDNIVTVSKGWSESYGMFLEGEADMVLSYTTSPAYHLIAEEDDSKAAAAFDEGHYMQIEVAGKVAGTDQSDLADQFLNFMVSDGFQSLIATTNWMYPAVTPNAGLPKGFETLITPNASRLVPISDAPALREEALQEWRAALSR
ncbi:MAG: thiamine ABC transporter substrate binding subunit [Halocynthiibacter sp.]